LHTGGPITPDALHTVMSQLRRRIIRLLESDEIKDIQERDRLLFLLNSKRFNPYCIRHSSISYDSDYLPEFALKKKVRWSMNSKQSSRYIKRRMGNELKTKILEHNGIITSDTGGRRPTVLNCPRCDLANAFEINYCSKCSYPLKPEAFDEIKKTEEERIRTLEQKYIQDMENLKNELEVKFQHFLEKVDLHKIA
jgi:hypothetical protein